MLKLRNMAKLIPGTIKLGINKANVWVKREQMIGAMDRVPVRSLVRFQAPLRFLFGQYSNLNIKDELCK